MAHTPTAVIFTFAAVLVALVEFKIGLDWYQLFQVDWRAFGVRTISDICARKVSHSS